MQLKYYYNMEYHSVIFFYPFSSKISQFFFFKYFNNIEFVINNIFFIFSYIHTNKHVCAYTKIYYKLIRNEMSKYFRGKLIDKNRLRI